MKSSKIIESWNRIEPDNYASERMLSAILEQSKSINIRKDNTITMIKVKKVLVPIAACFALMIAIAGIVGTNLNWFGSEPDSGTGIDGTVLPGGSVPEGIDPIMASVAVYPTYRDLSDVAEATLREITKDEAYGIEGLSEHLPSTVIDGYHFRNSSLYETIMKDGTKYYLLRVDYTTGDETVADYSVQLTSFVPHGEGIIYASDSIPGNITHEFFHFECNGVCFGMSPGDLTYDEIMAVISSIN